MPEKKLNCWEVMKCGREPGGDKVDECGICPAAIFAPADGFCGGEMGGRACVFITGTLCSGEVQGTFKEKEKNCLDCDFYKSLIADCNCYIDDSNFIKYVDKAISKNEDMKDKI